MFTYLIYFAKLMKKFFLAVLFFSFVPFCFGQKKNYPDAELLAFYKVYDYLLREPFNPLEAMQKLLPQTGFTEERMTEILQAEAIGRKVELSEQEKADRQKLQALLQKEKEKYDAEIEKMMQRENITSKKFGEIKKEFRRNPELQKKVYEIVKSQKKH